MYLLEVVATFTSVLKCAMLKLCKAYRKKQNGKKRKKKSVGIGAAAN